MLDNKVNEENFQFLNDSYLTILQNFGVQKLDEKNLNRITKTINRRFDIYNKLSTKEDRFIVKVKWAYFTMPHGGCWKMCHPKIWYHLKNILKEEEQSPEECSSGVVEQQQPAVQKSVDLNALSYTNRLSLRE